MSIDSKEKRAAVFGVGRPWLKMIEPVTTPDEQWRASSANSYGGNTLSPPVVSGGPAPGSLSLMGVGL